MKYGYNETNKDLSSRINVHDKLSEKDIDSWILDIVRIKEGENILDVGCGNGKQIISYGNVLENTGHIFATDLLDKMLSEAKENAEKNKINNVTFLNHNMDTTFNFNENSFDFISSCFSIYYVTDGTKIIDEFYRLLKKNGRLFIAGPAPKNTEDFLGLHKKVSGKGVSKKFLFRRARIETEFIPLMKKHFSNVTVKKFTNVIHFKTSKQLMDYYTSTLQFKESFKSKRERIEVKTKMKNEVEKIIEEKGEYNIIKEVYGVLGYKNG